jgi:L-threonylcarbamoyladenylate synthase
VPIAGAVAPRVSGRLAQHYAPRTPLAVVPPAALPARIAASAGRRLAVLAPVGVVPAGLLVHSWLAAPTDPVAYAQALYGFLHTLDAAGAQQLLIATPPTGPLWDAVHDRLRRAAAA